MVMNFIIKLTIFGAISTILLKWNSTAFYDYYLFRSKAHNESEISHERTVSDEDSNSENSEKESSYKRPDANFTNGEDVDLHKNNISELLNQIIEGSHRNEHGNGNLVGNSASMLSPLNRRKRSGKKFTLGYSLSRTIQETDDNVYIDINKTSIPEKTGIKSPDSVSNNIGNKDDAGSTSVDSPSKSSNSGNTNSPGSQSANGQNKNPNSSNGGVNPPTGNPPAPSLSTNSNDDGNKQTFVIDLEDPATSNTNKGTNPHNPNQNNQTPNVPQKPPPYVIDLEDENPNVQNVQPSSSNTGGNKKPGSNSEVSQSTNGQNKNPSSNSGNPPAPSPIGPSNTNNANDDVYIDLPHKNGGNGSPGSTSVDSSSKGSNIGNTNSPGSQSANGQNKNPSGGGGGVNPPTGNPPAPSPIGPSNTNTNDDVYIDLAHKNEVGNPGSTSVDSPSKGSNSNSGNTNSPGSQSANGQNKNPNSGNGGVNPPTGNPPAPSLSTNSNDDGNKQTFVIDLDDPATSNTNKGTNPHNPTQNNQTPNTPQQPPPYVIDLVEDEKSNVQNVQPSSSNTGGNKKPGSNSEVSQSTNGQNKNPSSNSGNPPAPSPIGPSNTNTATDDVYIDLPHKTVVNGSPGNSSGNNERSMKILESKNKENNASTAYSNSNIVTASVSASTSFTNIEHKVNNDVNPNILIDFPIHTNVADSFETTPHYADNVLELSAPIHLISATTTIPNIINISPKESSPKENTINLAIGQTETTSTSISASMTSYEKESNAVYLDLHVITNTKTPKEQPFESTTKKALENSKLGDTSLSFNSSTETVAIISSTVESNTAGILISSQISTSTPTTPTTDVDHGESTRKFTNSLTTNEVRSTTSAEYTSETPRVFTSIQGDAKTTRPVSATPDFIIEYFTFSNDPLERSNGHPASTFLDDYDVYKQRGSIYYHCC